MNLQIKVKVSKEELADKDLLKNSNLVFLMDALKNLSNKLNIEKEVKIEYNGDMTISIDSGRNASASMITSTPGANIEAIKKML